MENFEDSVQEWEYRAEGNFHIVIVNHRTRQVIRLPKCYKDQKILDDLSSLGAAASELSFVRHVAHPVMRNCKACYPIQQVLLSKEFLRNISKKVEPDRPPFRLQKVIDDDCKYGILMPDFCQVLPAPPNAVGSTITVEIKPKQGFLLKGHKTCKFSQFQRLKVKNRTYERESTYCPIDLFSGCRKRMQKAIKALIQHPQNNLRVFKNGNVVYSQECISGRSENPKELFRDNVLSLIIPHLRGDEYNDADKRKMASHNFQDILCNLLLYPICEQKPKITHTPQRCGRGCVERNKENLAHFQKLNGNTAHESLSPGCVLGILLYLQKLENHSISEYFKMYKRLKTHLAENPQDVSRLSLSGPYDSQKWQEVVSEICEKDILTTISEDDENLLEEDVDRVAYLLRKFLIAMSFKDCSLMMTFQKKQEDGKIDESKDLPLIIKTRTGQEYWGSLALVDSDPKPASRIPQYFGNASKNAHVSTCCT